jgi:5-formyltetrahydrofolate cyclo-ligase
MAPASPRDPDADPVTDPAAAPGDDTDRRKTELRRRLRARRTTLAATPDRARRDAALVTNLCRYLDTLDTLDAIDGRPVAVAAFAPLPGEPGGADLPDRLAATGRQVWLPVVDAPGRPLRWLPDVGPDHRRTAAYGIREPVPVPSATGVDAPLPLSALPAGLVVVLPALAVDADGVRLGQGGGFYDRTFAPDTIRHSGNIRTRAGAAYRGRLLALVDHEEFGVPVPRTTLDLAVPVVVTDDGVSPTGAHR